MMFSIATSSYFMPRRARTILRYSWRSAPLARPTRLPFKSSILLTPEPLRATIASGFVGVGTRRVAHDDADTRNGSPAWRALRKVVTLMSPT